MNQETMDATSLPPAATETESPAGAGLEPGAVGELPTLDTPALVARMVDAGAWPQPELLEQIAARGDEAVEPLLSILRSRPRGWPDEAPLCHALALLERLRPPSAMPELIKVITSYPEETGDQASDVIGCYGEIVFEPLLNLAADPAFKGKKRHKALSAARKAAGTNAVLRDQLLGLLRPMLANVIEGGKQRLLELTEQGNPGDFEEIDPDEEDMNDWIDEEPDDDLAENRPEIEIRKTGPQIAEGLELRDDSRENKDHHEVDWVGEVMFLVAELTAMADPLARDLIKTAFAEDLVETVLMPEEYVDAVYARGGDPPWVPPDFLSSYPDTYRQHFEALERTKQELSSRAVPPRQVVLTPPPPVPKPVAPIAVTVRKKEQPVGRNDPCWCGSGKKYKKCHLGKDTTA